MSWVAFVVVAVCSVLAPKGVRRNAVLVLALGAIIAVAVERGGLPIGYGAVGAIGTALALAVIEWFGWGPDRARAWFMAGLGLLGAVLSAAIATPGVDIAPALLPGSTPWTVVHIVIATVAFGAITGAAATAAWRLRGHAVGLLPLAVLLTALPLVTRGAVAHGYLPSGAAWLDLPVVDPTGGQGLIRTVPAWVALPGEIWVRLVALGGIMLAAWLAIADASAGRPNLSRVAAWIGRISAGAIVVRLLAACLPVALGSDDVSPALDAVRRELTGTETIGAFTAPTGLLGGAGAVTASLSVALVVLGLVWLGTAAPADAADNESTAPVEARLASLTTLFLTLTVLTGVAWSNFAWSGLLVPDPKLFATLVALGLSGVYHLMDSWLPSWRRAPGLTLVVAFLVLGWSMVGPDLGWVAPSLHRFGG